MDIAILSMALGMSELAACQTSNQLLLLFEEMRKITYCSGTAVEPLAYMRAPATSERIVTRVAE